MAAKYPQLEAAGFIQRVTVHYINTALMSVEILIGNGGAKEMPSFLDVKVIANDIKVTNKYTFMN